MSLKNIFLSTVGFFTVSSAAAQLPALRTPAATELLPGIHTLPTTADIIVNKSLVSDPRFRVQVGASTRSVFGGYGLRFDKRVEDKSKIIVSAEVASKEKFILHVQTPLISQVYNSHKMVDGDKMIGIAGPVRLAGAFNVGAFGQNGLAKDSAGTVGVSAGIDINASLYIGRVGLIAGYELNGLQGLKLENNKLAFSPTKYIAQAYAGVRVPLSKHRAKCGKIISFAR